MLLTALLVIGISSQALACTHTPPKPRIWITHAHIVTPNFGFWIYIIRVHKLTTFGTKVGSGQVCACAFRLPRDIAEIFAAKLVLSDTDIPYPGLSEFVFNKITGKGFNLLSNGLSDWVGFSAKVSQNIDPDVPVDLLFYARIKSDKDEAMKRFEEYVKSGQTLLGTSGANANGTPIVDKEHPDHTVVTAAGDLQIMPPKSKFCSTYDLNTGIFKVSDVEVDILNQKFHFAADMKTINQNPFQFELTNLTAK
ncbi:hypothetical protein [Candidatus Marithrix sp. Canyon 246]|uniref:hypothetical protein n=1 Tax=Candidatus Marithrix sp. Canyon 246 TaxID=1827136 RepID=UPI000849FBF1|nr:hypothetical protein [Candidatus Marithrix sp. Canyon 246]